MLTNGGFESGSNGWSLQSSTSGALTVQGAGAHDGSAGLRFNGTATEPLARQDKAVKGGQKLTFSGYAKIPTFLSKMSVMVELKAYDSAGNQLQYWRLKEFTGTTNGWTSMNSSVTLPSNAVKVRLQVRAPYLNGTAYFDCLSLR